MEKQVHRREDEKSTKDRMLEKAKTGNKWRKLRPAEEFCSVIT